MCQQLYKSMSLIDKNITKTDPTTQRKLHSINRAMDFIDTHINEKLSLTDIGNYANYSAQHLQKIFSETIGEGIGEYIKRLRLEQAIRQLIYNPSRTILNVSENCGFSNQANFSSTFKQHFGISPSKVKKHLHFHNLCQFRKIINNEINNHHFSSVVNSDMFTVYNKELLLQKLGAEFFDENTGYNRVQLTTISDIAVAYSRNIGGVHNPDKIGSAHYRFYTWLMSQTNYNNKKEYYTHTLDRTDFTSLSKCRYDVASTVADNFAENSSINTKIIKGGRYAMFSCDTSREKVPFIWAYLISVWLPSSAYELNNRPLLQKNIIHPDINPCDSFTVEFYLPLTPK